jgi:uncharacterized protein
MRGPQREQNDMSDVSETSRDLRHQILSDPNTILDDRDVMRALISAENKTRGNNVVDLRSIALERMEARLCRLEDTHRGVIAAAYDNLASTNQIHRAVLAILEPHDFGDFLALLHGSLADMLKVDCLRLCLETPVAEPGKSQSMSLEFGEGVAFFAPGEIDAYIRQGRSSSARTVTLRATHPRAAVVYGERANPLKSEALLKLDLGPGNLPGLLALGAYDDTQFRAAKGTDLLLFFGGVFESVMRRWLA